MIRAGAWTVRACFYQGWLEYMSSMSVLWLEGRYYTELLFANL